MLAGELALAQVDVAVVERRVSQDLIGVRSGGLHSVRGCDVGPVDAAVSATTERLREPKLAALHRRHYARDDARPSHAVHP